MLYGKRNPSICSSENSESGARAWEGLGGLERLGLGRAWEASQLRKQALMPCSVVQPFSREKYRRAYNFCLPIDGKLVYALETQSPRR